MQGKIELWGHEYLRNLAGEIGDEYNVRREQEQSVEDLLELVSQIVPYHMAHNSGALCHCLTPDNPLSLHFFHYLQAEGTLCCSNRNHSALKRAKLGAEPEAVDLLLEVDKLDWLLERVDEKNYRRACLYLSSCCSYLPEPDDMAVLQAAYEIYRKLGQLPDAVRIALRMKRLDLVEETFAAEKDPLGKKQLAYILGHQVLLPSYSCL